MERQAAGTTVLHMELNQDIRGKIGSKCVVALIHEADGSLARGLRD
jgi:hypothetical protein